jgi:hypothetical protein
MYFPIGLGLLETVAPSAVTDYERLICRSSEKMADKTFTLKNACQPVSPVDVLALPFCCPKYDTRTNG